MRSRPATRVFVLHVVTLGAAALSVLGAIAAGTAALLTVAGACLVASGVLAFAGRRSLLRPRAVDRRLGSAADDAERTRVEQAGAMLTGTLLVFFGAVGIALGLAITLS